MENDFLNEQAQKELLALARRTLELYLSDQALLSLKSETPLLQRKSGAFVTLHAQGELRGCIGRMFAEEPLHQTVRDMAIAAATEDFRFEPVSFEELFQIDIEISVLTPFQKIQDLDEIEVGKHGLFITQGRHRGLLLPQVASEHAWNREEFLAHTCIKAGLLPKAWMDPKTQIEIFSAQVFGEEK